MNIREIEPNTAYIRAQGIINNSFASAPFYQIMREPVDYDTVDFAGSFETDEGWNFHYDFQSPVKARIIKHAINEGWKLSKTGNQPRNLGVSLRIPNRPYQTHPAEIAACGRQVSQHDLVDIYGMVFTLSLCLTQSRRNNGSHVPALLIYRSSDR